MYDQSLSQMAGVKALHVVCNPFSQRTILIVSAKQWQVFEDRKISINVKLCNVLQHLTSNDLALL
jgi:hypothetical protein